MSRNDPFLFHTQGRVSAPGESGCPSLHPVEWDHLQWGRDQSRLSLVPIQLHSLPGNLLRCTDPQSQSVTAQRESLLFDEFSYEMELLLFVFTFPVVKQRFQFVSGSVHCRVN